MRKIRKRRMAAVMVLCVGLLSGCAGKTQTDDLVGFHLTDVLAAVVDLAALHFQQAGDGVHGSRFTGTVGADEGDDLAVGYLKADAAQRLDAAVGYAQILNLQHLQPPPNKRR